MARPPLEVADIIRAHRDDLVESRNGRIAAVERRVFDDIAACRTAACGGHVQQCDQCSHLRIAYNSCRNRHCPKCQELPAAEWLSERQSELLPVEYFHVVFSIPHELAAIALQNKKVVYGLLFQATAETLRQVAADPKHLGAEIGCLAVLHTWGQNLDHHPHVHCVVPGGGISRDGSKWISCRPGFFLPVRVLSRLFRGKFLHHLRRAFEKGRLSFHGSLEQLRDSSAFRSYLSPLYKKKWVVYAKPPFGSPERVFNYLARYTHRVAISNSRLVSMKAGSVSFTWKDYAHGCRLRVMTLSAVEFLRRFLLHRLPKGFVRIRHYGFLANRHRKKKIELCRELVTVRKPLATQPFIDEPQTPRDQALQCPQCSRGRLICILTFKPGESIANVEAWTTPDTS
ncbi:MAG: IS91 family transposase [bacterium]|nr:IS91 family transposase [bacterium]